MYQLKIKVPHPCHPSTRVSVQVPTLGIHLSPSRFSLLMELLKILSGTIESGTKLVEDCQAEHAPWNSPDLATEAQILVWRVCALSCIYEADVYISFIFNLFCWLRG